LGFKPIFNQEILMANVGLYRSNRSNMIAGVMGGIAERFGWNANLLRLIFVVISLMSAAFPGILVYLVLWLVMPKKQYTIDHDRVHQPQGYQNPVRTVNQDKRY
jgi:phage shock protein PspC (stress-responsive transcriptional regulator)